MSASGTAGRLRVGVIGSYLGRVYVEAQDRPFYAVASVARGDNCPLDRQIRSRRSSG
jgi:hypothetical protein